MPRKSYPLFRHRALSVVPPVRLWSPREIKITNYTFYTSHYSCSFLFIYFFLFTAVYTKTLYDHLTFECIMGNVFKIEMHEIFGVAPPLNELKDTNTNGPECNLSPQNGRDRPIPGITFYNDTRRLPSQCAACRTLKLSRNTTSIASSEMLHGPPRRGLPRRCTAFLSFPKRLIYSTNSARSYTPLGRIP